MTSLAKQLQRLAVPRTQAVYGEDKYKKSLLFDPSEAALLDRETVFSLGVNGLEELTSIDASFEEYDKSLFAESSLSFDRSMQTKEVNKEMDKNISKFLHRLSPYILLKPSHKALEWLIHRYYIHEYNTDDLMMCVLPYHESKVFVRVTQLLHLDSKTATKWDWLQPLQKSGVHLAKSVLINHCITNPSLLSFICQSVYSSVQLHVNKTDNDIPQLRTLFSFYTSTVIGIIESTKVTEELISTLLVHISHGLSSKVLQYKASTYMIIAQLMFKVKLQQELVSTLLKAVSKNLTSVLMKEALSCLLLMFQTQHVTVLPKRCYRHLCRQPTIIDSLAWLTTSYKADSMLQAFLKRLIPNAVKERTTIATSGESSDSDSEGSCPQYQTMLIRLLSQANLSEQTAKQAITWIIKDYLKFSICIINEEELHAFNVSLRSIVRLLEGRYSRTLDDVVEHVLQTSNSKSAKEDIQNFLKLSVLSIQHHSMSVTGTSLSLTLNHQNYLIRKSAVEHLLENVEQQEDLEFVSESLLSRLQDDKPEVVQATLNAGKDLWMMIEKPEKFLKVLETLVNMKETKAKWKNVGTRALEVMCMCPQEVEEQVLPLLIPNFFLSTDDKLEDLQLIFQSPLSKQNLLIGSVSKKWKSTKMAKSRTIGQVNTTLAQALAESLLSIYKQDTVKMVLSWSSSDQSPKLSAMLLLLLDKLITLETDKLISIQLCHCETELIKKARTLVKRRYKDGVEMSVEEAVMRTCDNIVKAGTLDEHLLIVALQRMVTHMSTFTGLVPNNIFWVYNDEEQENRYCHLLVTVFDLLLDLSSHNSPSGRFHRQIVRQFTKTFKNVAMLFKFLGIIWTQHCNPNQHMLGLNVTLQARALQIGKTHLHHITPAEVKVMNTHVISVLVNLLIAMTSPHRALREQAVECLVTMETSLIDDQMVFSPLVRKIIRCQHEITEDEGYITQVITSVFKNVGKELTSPGRKRRSFKLDLKQQTLNSLMEVITQADTPIFIQRSLLQLLQNVTSTELLSNLLPLLDKLLTEVTQSHYQEDVFNCIHLILHRYTEDTASILKPDNQGLQLLLTSLCSLQAAGHDQSVQLVALNQITRELYDRLTEESQRKLFHGLVDVWTKAETPAVASVVRRIIKHLSLNSIHVAEEIQSCLLVSSASTVRQAKRRKRESTELGGDSQAEFDKPCWQRITVLLEGIQEKKKLGHSAELLPVCFLLLQRVLDSDQHASAEYIKQLVLSLIYHVCRKISAGQDSAESISEAKFNMELIVQCIRTSENPQTHHQALLVLTTAAKLYPEHLLHNIMSVFTFMGANILRQDDAYSIQIISRILETVIPALITACEQRTKVPEGVSNDIEDIITMVMRVFVDAFPYIPQHRRLMLFTKLVQIVGDKKYLWRLLLLLVEHIINRGTQSTDQNLSAADKLIQSSGTEFCLQLCAQFSVPLQLSSSTDIITYLTSLPEEKTDDAARKKISLPQSLGKLKKEDTELFNVVNHSAKQLRHFKYEAVLMLISLHTSQDFIIQISESYDVDFLPHFQTLVQTIMQYVMQVTRSTHTYQEQPSSRFWKAFLHKLYDLLEKVVNLLPEEVFIQVVDGLLDHTLPSIQRKALELLSNKLNTRRDTIKDKEAGLLLPLVDKTGKLLEKWALFGEGYEENAVNAQTALYSLKLLCRSLGSKNPHTFIKVLKICTQLFHNRDDNHQVCACALLCIAEICNTLKIHIISYLSSFMPKVLGCLKSIDVLVTNELYVLSVVTTLVKVVENLSLFLSPYITDILFLVSRLSVADQEQEVMKKPQLQTRLKAIRNALATMLPTRVLLPSISSCYEKMSKTNMDYLSPVMTILEEHITKMSREDLASHSQQLQDFFLLCLELRATHTEVPESQMSLLEGCVISAIITMVMKLSEATFRPFLFKLFDWATRDESTKMRVMVFYRLADSLAEKLRSLFLIFASHFIKHTAHILDENNSSKCDTGYFGTGKHCRRQSHQLLVYVLDCLYKCFLYDTEGFVNQERFDCLMQPLVDQLENIGKSEKQYRKRVSDHVIPCGVQFAVAAQDVTLWKSVNYQILLKTRHKEAKVRYASLRMVDELHKKLGEDYMTLLPETIPFLAELMEDECEEVEKECQSVIGEMEKTLGEPLQKYF